MDLKMLNIDEFLKPTRLICEIIGMWPANVDSQTMFKNLFTKFRRFLALVAIGNILVPQFIAIIESRGNLSVITRIGCVSITVALLVYKMMYLIFYGQELARIYLTVIDFWGADKLFWERKIYEGYARKGKIFTIVFLLSGLANNVIFTGTAIFDWIIPIYRGEGIAESKIQRHLPYEVRYGFDIESSPSFEVAFVCQTISGLFCCMGIVGLDSLMLTLVLHVCGQFVLVQFLYQDIQRKTMANNEVNISDNLRREIQRCSRHHQEIIHLVEDLEALLSPLIFIQFVTNAAKLCLSGFAVTIGMDKTTDLMIFSNYLISMMMQLFAWSMVGEMLTQESENVGRAIFYDIPWYEFAVHFQRDLHMVLLRSQKSCRLTAAKFQTMNVNSLGTMFSSAVSYFTLLRQLR